MKKTFFKTLALGLLAWAFMAPTKAEAQVGNPYPVVNTTTCQVKIVYTFYRLTSAGCNNPCPGGSGSLIVPPSPPVTTIPYPTSCQACAVRIEVVGVNGIAVVPPIVAAFNQPPIPSSAGGPDPSGCSPTGMINLNVMPTMTQITP